jgi:hypothetical protein
MGAGPFVFYLLLCAGVGYLAKNCGRSIAIWFCLAVLFTPLLTVLFLIIAGVPAGDEEVDKSISEEVAHEIEENEKSLILEQDIQCPNCNAAINLYTGKGVVVPDENSPWDIHCASCGNNLSV